MGDIGFDKTALLFGCWIDFLVDRVRNFRVMIVVAPFCEVICELEAWNIGIGVFEVDDDKLLVLVSRREKG